MKSLFPGNDCLWEVVFILLVYSTSIYISLWQMVKESYRILVERFTLYYHTTNIPLDAVDQYKKIAGITF